MTHPKPKNDAVSLQNTFELEKRSVCVSLYWKKTVWMERYVIPTVVYSPLKKIFF